MIFKEPGVGKAIGELADSDRRFYDTAADPFELESMAGTGNRMKRRLNFGSG